MVKVKTFIDCELQVTNACHETAGSMEKWLNKNFEKNNIKKIFAITEFIDDGVPSRTVVAEIEKDIFP